MVPPIFSGKWPRKTTQLLVSAISYVVFLFLDFLDIVLCVFYRFVDEFVEGKATPCYCHNRGEEGRCVGNERESEASETLHGRKNVFREMGFYLGFPIKWEGLKGNGDGKVGNRWSDCGCESCVSWVSNGDQRLHVVVGEPSRGITRTTQFVVVMNSFHSVEIADLQAYPTLDSLPSR